MDAHDYIMLDQHLRYNYYPPIPEMLDAAVKAIDLTNDGEGWSYVDLPTGACVQAWDVVEELHLEFFLTREDWADV